MKYCNRHHHHYKKKTAKIPTSVATSSTSAASVAIITIIHWTVSILTIATHRKHSVVFSWHLVNKLNAFKH